MTPPDPTAKPGPYRPSRVELFAFYYLGFNPDGEYRFANANTVAKHYNVSVTRVLEWLKDLDLEPGMVLRKEFDLSGPMVELQLERVNLTPMEIHRRAGEILKALDAAPGGRRFWEDPR